MPDAFVRVKLENGSEASVSPEFAELHDLNPLDKPASRDGVALAAKHNPLKQTKKSAASASASTPEETK